MRVHYFVEGSALEPPIWMQSLVFALTNWARLIPEEKFRLFATSSKVEHGLCGLSIYKRAPDRSNFGGSKNQHTTTLASLRHALVL